MRRFENHTRYGVEISASAWKQLSLLPLDAYMHIRGELDAVAMRLASMEPPPHAVRTEHPTATQSLTVGEHIARYVVDAERRILILLDVSQR